MAAPYVIPLPPTVAVGDKIPAASWNAYVKGTDDFLQAPPRALVYAGATQNFTTAVAADIAFNTESVDAYVMHDTVTNNNRLTIPVGYDGVWVFSAQADWPAATGLRSLTLLVNGTTAIGRVRQDASSGICTQQIVSHPTVMAAGDYCTVQATQISGGTIATQSGLDKTWFAAQFYCLT